VTGRLRAALPDRLRTDGAAAVLVLLLSFLPRHHFTAAGLFHVDEVLVAQAVEKTASEGVLAGEVNGRYGTVLLTTLAYLPWRALTGEGAEKAILAVGVVSGTLVVLLSFLLVRALAGSLRVALLAAAFLNFNALFLVTTTGGKEHTLLLLFVLLSLHLLLRGARSGSLPLRLLGMAAYAFSLSVHEAGLVFAPVVAAFLVHSGLAHGAPRRRVASELLLLTAFAALPLLAYLGKVAWAEGAASNGAVLPFLPRARVLLPPMARKLVSISGWPWTVLLLPGLVLARRHRLLFTLLLAWLPLSLYFGSHESGSERYLLFVLVPFSILPALAVEALAVRAERAGEPGPPPGAPAAPPPAGGEEAERREGEGGPASRGSGTGEGRGTAWRGWAVAALAAAAICGHGLREVWTPLSVRSASVGPKAMALFVRDRTEPEAKVLVMDEAPFIEYYGRRKALLHPVGTAEDTTVPDRMRAFANGVGDRVLAGEPVYIVHTAMTYDATGTFRAMMDDGFDYLPVGSVEDEKWVRDIVGYDPMENGLFRLVLPTLAPGTLRKMPPFHHRSAAHAVSPRTPSVRGGGGGAW
jgi:hypothetical protein